MNYLGQPNVITRVFRRRLQESQKSRSDNANKGERYYDIAFEDGKRDFEPMNLGGLQKLRKGNAELPTTLGC